MSFLEAPSRRRPEAGSGREYKWQKLWKGLIRRAKEVFEFLFGGSMGWKASGFPKEQIVTYPRPPVEQVREKTFGFVTRLEQEGLITPDEARSWKENLERDFQRK